MTRVLTLAALVGLAASPLTAEEPAKKDNVPATLPGTYLIVSGERGGKPIPAEEIKGALVEITKTRIVSTDKDRKELFAATYRLDTSMKPNRIHMTSTVPAPGTKAVGVIEVTGDTIKVCYNLPGGKVPTDFKTEENQQCFVLKRRTGDGEK